MRTWRRARGLLPCNGCPAYIDLGAPYLEMKPPRHRYCQTCAQSLFHETPHDTVEVDEPAPVTVRHQPSLGFERRRQ